MKTYTKKQLETILKKHKKWLNFESGGEKADLSYADLRRADLRRADLSDANLSDADLRRADLSYADLRRADLSYALLPKETINEINKYRPFQICPQEGEFIAWKKGDDGCILKVLIPKSAKRTSSLIGRKCRASKVKVLAIWDRKNKPIKSCGGWKDSSFIYTVGKVKKPDSYNDDIRIECTNGIHFLITREEAEVF